MTPAAVGFQIKQLEEELGGTLFLRKHRAIELTNKGNELLANLGPVFKTIQKAWDAAHEPIEPNVLKVSGPARAIHSWVLPAIRNAKDKPPDLRISWDLSKQNRDVMSGEVDMAIRWALEPEGDLYWEPLLRTWFTPLVRPDVARFIKRPDDLLKHGLIGVDFLLDAGTEKSAWAAWHQVNDLAPPMNFAVTCADTATAVETALATGHVAIAGSFLSLEHVAKGELVAPFDTAIVPNSRFWLVCRRGLEKTSEYRWFLSAVKRSMRAIDATAEDIQMYHPDGSRVSS